jgi:hypothetical protein
MNKKLINGYELQPEVLLCKNRPCRVFIPPISAFGTRIYWVEYLDNQDVDIVQEKDLKVTKNGKLLYGEK